MPKAAWIAALILVFAVGVIFGSNTAVPGGVDGSIQYNVGGAFAGSSDWLHFDYVNGRLGIHTTMPSSLIQVDVIDDGTFHYLQIDSENLTNSTPPASDCDNQSEVGRLFFSDEPGNGRLFVCNGATDGWLSTQLS